MHCYSQDVSRQHGKPSIVELRPQDGLHSPGIPSTAWKLMIAGVSRKKELDYYYQVQAAAIAVNKSDPNLVQWMKLPTNPLGFELPAGGTHAEFRDPITPFELVPPLPSQDPCYSWSRAPACPNRLPAAAWRPVTLGAALHRLATKPRKLPTHLTCLRVHPLELVKG